MAPDESTSPETRCARGADAPGSTTRALAPSLHLSSVWKADSLDSVDAIYEGQEPGFLYARDGHPNLVELASKIAGLEGAQAAWVGASGMAVEAALFLSGLGSGDRVALAEGVYGKTGRLVSELERFGVAVARFDATDPATLRAIVDARTRIVFAETLSNPLLRLADIPDLAREAHAAGARLAIDHTFAPLLCRPIELGADLVIHSLTKLIGGHSDLTQGAVAGGAPEIGSIASLGSTFGLTGNPFECWLALRGMATLPVRSERACGSARVLADWLEQQPAVRAVHYPGLSSHPDHARAGTTLSGGFGSVLTLDLGSRERAGSFIRALSAAIPFAPSLGDVSTTLSHPATTSHRGQTEEQWQRQGITPGLIRLSVGLENPVDLQREIAAALQRIG
jgi:cystathionine beta-lyase/cystathionine gamma-synthase